MTMYTLNSQNVIVTEVKATLISFYHDYDYKIFNTNSNK